jgi:hypothetical protein
MNLWRYLTEAVPWGLGWPAAIVGVTGVVVMLFKRRPRIVAATFCLLLLFLSLMSLWWVRWVLPLMPLLAIAATYLLALLERRLPRSGSSLWLWPGRLVVAASLIGPLAGPTLASVGPQATNDDTRIRAIEWFEEHVPPGSSVLIDSSTAQLSSDRYDVWIAALEGLVRWKDVHDKARPEGYFGILGEQWTRTPEELLAQVREYEIDCVVLADTWIDLASADPSASYAIADYQALLDTFPIVDRFDREDASLGPAITVLGVDDGCQGGQS